MSKGNINIKLRPLKLLYLISPYSKADFLKVINVNSFLWGGVYNPIVQYYKRNPEPWRFDVFRKKSKQVIEGYIDTFDPDYIVNSSNMDLSKLYIGNREIISIDDIFGIEKKAKLNYGASIIEIFDDFVIKELKYLQRKPYKFVIPQYSQYNLLLKSLFGELDSVNSANFMDLFAKEINFEYKACSLENFTDLFEKQNIYLNRISTMFINNVRTRSGWTKDYIFLMDSNSLIDIVDFWNLRAIGKNIIPFPIQTIDCKTILNYIKKFSEKHHYPFQGNPKLFNEPHVLISRCLRNESFKRNSEDSIRDLLSQRQIGAIQQWAYPRMWDEWARDKDGVEYCEINADSMQIKIEDVNKDLSIETLTPKFLSNLHNKGGQYVNEISFSVWDSGEDSIAEVIPECDDSMCRPLNTHSYFYDWRFSRNGMCYISKHNTYMFHLTLAKSEEVFKAWLKYKGWVVDISSIGHIAKQMYKWLGGKNGYLSILNDEGIINLLIKFNHEKTIPLNSVIADISKIGNQSEFQINPTNILINLIRYKIIKLGITIQCPICQQHSWFSISEIDYDISCPVCSQRFSFPSFEPNKLSWSYKAIGPFSLDKHSIGVYNTLSTLKFFMSHLYGAITPIFSFNLTDKFEVDLGIIYQINKFGSSKIEPVFVECKTYNRFTKNDIERMKFIAKKFPGSTIVFSTFNRELNQSEKKVIVPFVNNCRRYWKSDRPYNYVLILTGTELFSNWPPSYSWKDKKGIYEKFSKDQRIYSDLEELCNITQQIYLGLDSLHEFWQKKWDKRKTSKLVKETSS